MKRFSQLAPLFMNILAVITGCTHFVILTIGHRAISAGAHGESFS